MPVEQQRKPETERELEYCRHAGIDEGIPDRGAKNAVVRQHDKIMQADEAAGHADLGVGHRELDAFHERIGDEHRQQQHGRQQQDERQPALVFQESRNCAAPRCAGVRLGKGIAGDGHCDLCGSGGGAQALPRPIS